MLIEAPDTSPNCSGEKVLETDKLWTTLVGIIFNGITFLSGSGLGNGIPFK
jgi:hypothetical protein